MAKLFPKEEEEEEGFNDEDEGKRRTTSSTSGSGDDSDDDDTKKLKKKTNKKKEDSIRRLESRYRGIKVDLLDAPRECAMRTCLVHCGAREAKLEGVDGREEEEMGDAETIHVGAGSKKDQKISSLEESQQNENKRRLLSPYIYTHTSLRTESVHKNREGTLSLSLSFCTALFLYTS